MSSFAAAFRKAERSQQNLLDDRERCSADPHRLKAIRCELGQQVRIIRSASERALYAV